MNYELLLNTNSGLTLSNGSCGRETLKRARKNWTIKYININIAMTPNPSTYDDEPASSLPEEPESEDDDV